MLQLNEELQSLLIASSLRKFQRGRIILYQGELPQYTYFVKSGVIKAYSITELGEEKIATFISSNEIFPMVWPEGSNSLAMYYYEALNDCEVYLIHRDKLLNYLQQSPTASLKMLQYAMLNYTSSLIRVTALQQPKAQDKIAHILHHLIQRYGQEVKKDKYEILLHLTHQDIASYIGLTRETTAIELSKLKRNNVITYKNKRYTVEKSKLLGLINEDSLSAVQF